jgi:hypothetical protein
VSGVDDDEPSLPIPIGSPGSFSNRVYNRAGALAQQTADSLAFPPTSLSVALIAVAASAQLDALLVELDLEMARRAAWEAKIEQRLGIRPATSTLPPESD